MRRIVAALVSLGPRYHRYLHQDEFGPIRAEKTAALRVLTSQLRILISLLAALPEDLRRWVSERVADDAPICRPIPTFDSCDHDVELLLLLAGATGARGAASASSGLAEAAERLANSLSMLDTEASALVDEFQLPPLNAPSYQADYFTFVLKRLERLDHRVERALAQLTRQRGPDSATSFKWLVTQLCDLYRRETGEPVTNSAVQGYFYNGIPQSRAGRFALACVKALQPSEAWLDQPDHRVAHRRARVIGRGTPKTAVYSVMRQYVAAQAEVRGRRGRPKRVSTM